MDPVGNVKDDDVNCSKEFVLNLDSSNIAATQQWEDQQSPGYDSRDDDDASDFVDTMLVDDSFFLGDEFQTQPADDAGETQSLDLYGETQSLDLDGETELMDHDGGTQMIDLAGETQVVDDVYHAKKFPTELFSFPSDEIIHLNGYEEQDKIEVMETQQSTQADSLTADGRDSVALVNKVDFFSGNQDDNVAKIPSDIFSTEEHISESVFEGFTSIRASSVRASGLAARARRVSSCAISNEKPYSYNKTNEKSLWNDSTQDRTRPRCQNTSKTSITRKLFTEDVALSCPSGVNINLANEITNIPVLHESENIFPAGLSYANSEEPGELSQANALEVVDRYLELNATEYDLGLDYRNHFKKEANAVKGAIGSHDLAKSSNFRSTSEKCRAYDWDDTCEDEGGGEFFQKKKELFFVTGKPRERSFTKPKKFNGAELISIKVGADKITVEEKVYKGKSGLALNTKRGKGVSVHKDEMFSNNLVRDLGDHSKVETMHNLDEDDNVKNAPNTNDVGPDTQMAVEAMETLCFEVNLSKSNGHDPGESVNVMKKALTKDQSILGVAKQGKHMKSTGANTINNSHSSVSSVKQTRSNIKEHASMADQRMRGDANDDDYHCDCANLMIQTSREDRPSFGVVTRQAKGVKRTSINTNNDSHSTLSLKQIKSNTKQSASESGKVEHRMQRDANDGHGQGHDGNASLMIKSKREVPTTFGIVTRQAKRVKKSCLSSNNDSHFPPSSVKQTKVIRKRNASKSALVEKRIEADVSDDFFNETTPLVKKKQRDGISFGNISDIDSHCDSEIMDLKHETKSLLIDQLNFYVPIAHRTRKCTKFSSAEAADKKFVIWEGIIDPSCARVPRRRRTSAHYKNDEKGAIKKIDKLTSRAENFVLQQAMDIECSRDGVDDRGSNRDNVQVGIQDADKVSDVKNLSTVESANTICRMDASPRERCRTSFENCSSPSTSISPRKSVSPICMGSEYHKLSCRKNLSRFSLMKEIDSLVADSPIQVGGTKELRKRKDNTSIRVLFSQHLDVDIVKQQKKILSKLGAPDASSMSDATHFVADEFVRTRNMLEAIAYGKPVVTHMWLESCGQTSCFVNEKNYTLRDARKEMEFGFSMPVSLLRASQKPLLLGQRVLITQNTKPGKNIISNLVKAVHGLVVERLGRSSLKDGKLPHDLLILSCEEDYDSCFPFLEKGFAVYSAELLLNGIVKQKLEYERYRLFSDQIRRTRSRILVKKSPTAPTIESK